MESGENNDPTKFEKKKKINWTRNTTKILCIGPGKSIMYKKK